MKYFLSILFTLTIINNSFGSEQTNIAASFWSAYCSGDISKLKPYYADSIKVRAGSEVLKPVWGVANKGDRSKGRSFSRSDLMKGYSALISKLGKDNWKSIFSSIQNDKIKSKVLKSGNVLLTVQTGPGGDYIEFELSQNKDQGKWSVISEYTDL